MASIKNLKKDIDTLMSLVLNDCFYVLEYNQKVDSAAVMDIAYDVINQHREFRKRINHPDGKDNPKIIKKSCNQIVSDMFAFADKSLEKLSAEVKKVAVK
ncbi:MAG: hypothetical protein CSA36_07985 [Draconibacterium sp.]|nr:MAG: hypothetical protein CSA36_07985 [Draconibacterium sp.]